MKKTIFFAASLLLLLAPTMLFAGAQQEAKPTGEAAAVEETATGELREFPAYWPPTGEKTMVMIGDFKEAPMLKEKVASGELPPVDQRVPKEPLVLKPIEEIGKYGGSRVQVRQPNRPHGQLWRNSLEFPLIYSTPYLNAIYPNVLKSWETSADAKTYVFYFREGMKWSDGDSFDADDMMFWYEDVLKNDILFPSKPANIAPAGVMAQVKKLDQYSVQISFTEPNPLFTEEAARWRPPPYVPSHYMKQFHPNHTSQAAVDKAVKDAGYDTWNDFFTDLRENMRNIGIPGVPGISPWMPINDQSEPIFILERNPFYWKVDTVGNQLPYIDRIEQTFADIDSWLLQVMAGDVPYSRAGYIGGTPNLSILLQNRKSGDYRITGASWIVNTYGTLYLNFVHEDPILRELFNDKRFRIALSVGIDRDEMNELLYDGYADGSQARPVFGPPFEDDELFKRYTEYDPDRANRLLDELGLTKRDGDGYRLRPDGKRLVVSVMGGKTHPPENPEMMNLYEQYWAKIGIDAVVRIQDPALLTEMMRAGKHDIVVQGIALGWRPANPLTRGSLFPLSAYWGPCAAWGAWCVTDGKEGVEPPEIVKNLYQMGKDASVVVDEEKRNAMIAEMVEMFVEDLLVIGGLNEPQRGKYFVIANNLRNVHVPGQPTATEDYPAQLSQWFFKY